MKHIFLGHLSDENNMPELALETVRCELLMKHKNYENFTKIEVASRDKPSEKIILESSIITDGKTA